MEKVNDGGPAFPVMSLMDKEGNFTGMTLRDYFAAAYIKGIYACSINGACGNFMDVAKDAYASADAMLKAREDK